MKTLQTYFEFLNEAKKAKKPADIDAIKKILNDMSSEGHDAESIANAICQKVKSPDSFEAVLKCILSNDDDEKVLKKIAKIL